jgi:hypothetical protein
MTLPACGRCGNFAEFALRGLIVNGVRVPLEHTRYLCFRCAPELVSEEAGAAGQFERTESLTEKNP